MHSRRLEFDLVLDRWPARKQGRALWSLVASGDIEAVRLPRGFVGLRIQPAQTLVYIEDGRPYVRQVLPQPHATGRRYQRTGTR